MATTKATADSPEGNDRKKSKGNGKCKNKSSDKRKNKSSDKGRDKSCSFALLRMTMWLIRR